MHEEAEAPAASSLDDEDGDGDTPVRGLIKVRMNGPSIYWVATTRKVISFYKGRQTLFSVRP